jgi:pimeloyl-ACP methyl ester carboxylesterase
MHVERSGPHEAADTVVCVHGLTANVRAFDLLRDDLVAAGVAVVAMDLRGRGHSEITAPGSYGLEAHARDVVAIAEALGLVRWHHVGWSMGALIGLELAGLAGARLETMTLIDHAGAMDPAALDAVRAGTVRLDAVVPDPETYFAAMRATGCSTRGTRSGRPTSAGSSARSTAGSRRRPTARRSSRTSRRRPATSPSCGRI